MTQKWSKHLVKEKKNFFSSFVAKMFSCRWNVFQACVWGLSSIFPHAFNHLHAFASPIASLSALFSSGDNSKQPRTSSKSWQRLKRERERKDESLQKERKRWRAIWPADSDRDKHLGLLQVWSERDGKVKTGGEENTCHLLSNKKKKQFGSCLHFYLLRTKMKNMSKLP